MVKMPAGMTMYGSVSFSGNTYDMKEDSDTVWSVKIPGIKASRLGSEITVEGEAEGHFTITVSALSYVRSVLNSDKYDETTKNAVSALYKYFVAVQAYN